MTSRRMWVAGVLAGLAGAASAEQPPVAVTNSPPPPIMVIPPRAFPPPIAPPPPGPRVVRPPQLRTAIAALVTPDDYPPSALAQKRQGRVDFILTVGPDGRVHGCAIVRSSGSAALDSATCLIMRRRARFTPAIDSNGNPATGEVRLFFKWTLP
jgi:periplasmic protein TonB